METRIEYQVLAPDSVAWYIQAALTADRSGNVAARDRALAEAQRVAMERRLVDGPAPEGSRVLRYDVAHECNGVRLAELERAAGGWGQRMSALARRVDALEEWQVAMATDSDGDDTLYRIYDQVLLGRGG